MLTDSFSYRFRSIHRVELPDSGILLRLRLIERGNEGSAAPQ